MRQTIWTCDSLHLQRWIATHLTDLVPLSCAWNHDMIRHLQEDTRSWRAAPPQLASKEQCLVATLQPQQQKPSLLWALSLLEHVAPDVMQNILEEAAMMPSTQYELSERIAALASTSPPEEFHWFHTEAGEVLRILTHDETAARLIPLDPRLAWCCALWKQYAHIYDYFVPLNVQYRFEQQLHCTQQHRWTWQQRTFALDVLMPHQNVHPHILEHLCYRITMMANLAPHACPRLHLRWYPSGCKKYIGSSISRDLPCTLHRVWNPYQINTGATYRHTCDTIAIWRVEEAAKTFLHEMIHGFGWDFDNPPGIETWVTRHFAVHPNSTIVFFECYVETWATLLNLYMTVAYATPPLSPDINALLGTEQRFVMFQVAKILHHSGFLTWDAFFQRTPTKRKSDTLLHQTTGVFSYFVVRSALLWDVAWFVETFQSPAFRESPFHNTTCDPWLAHLLDVFDSASYRTAMDHVLTMVAKHAHEEAKEVDDDADAFVWRTMRMTSVELTMQ
jgi:hypothetical protein